MSSILSELIKGPFPEHQPFHDALLAVEASEAASAASDELPGGDGAEDFLVGEPPAADPLKGFERARDAAKAVLGARESWPMWLAYTRLAIRHGQYKVCGQRAFFQEELGEWPWTCLRTA